MECDWKNTNDYWSIAKVIDTHSSAPPTWKKSCDRFFGCGLCSFLFPERSTEEETPIARRAVSGSCVCVHNLRSLFCGFVAIFINWAWPFGLCSFLFPDREIYRGRDAYC